MDWWAAVDFELPPYGNRTTLRFDLSGYSEGPSLSVVVAEEVVGHFDSIEYRFDGDAPPGQRLAIRWNDGPWIVGGVDNDTMPAFPQSLDVRINNGGPADWDPMWGSIDPVSLYSSQIPAPGAGCLPWGLALAFVLRHRINPRQI
jgi:hypothetical protein